MYVDDGVCSTTLKELYETFIADLSKKYTLSAKGRLNWYLGVSIKHDLEAGVSTLSQERYIETLLNRFSMTDCHSAPTPSDPNIRLLRSQSPAVPNLTDTKHFQQMVGGLMYASTLTRPDISFAVNQCARFMSNPGPEHIAAAKRILQYLKGTKDLKLTYRRQPSKTANVLISYADSDHAGDPDTRRSVTGYVVMLNGAAISWQSTRQQVTALSTAEAEYYAASVAGTDVTYLRRVMDDLGHEQTEPTVLWEDNMACIYMSQTSVMYHKELHIDTRVYHLRELCKAKVMVLEKVSSAEQVADSLTKSTPKPAFVKHSDAMLGITTLPKSTDGKVTAMTVMTVGSKHKDSDSHVPRDSSVGATLPAVKRMRIDDGSELGVIRQRLENLENEKAKYLMNGAPSVMQSRRGGVYMTGDETNDLEYDPEYDDSYDDLL